jgi:hypothetical protein
MNKHIKRVFDELFPYAKESADGYLYEWEIFIDRRDIDMSDRLILSIVSDPLPFEAFYEEVRDWEIEAIFQEQSYIEKEIIKKLEKEGYEFEYSDVSDWIEENVRIYFPVDDILEANEVMLNVWVETGEGNYDYTLNNYIGYSVTYEPIQEKSSLLWLARQQGYSKEELLDAVMNGNTKGSKFLESVVDEQNNLTSHMNRLEFFIRMPLLDVIKIKEGDIKEDFIIPKKTSCGLVDHWMGAGSILGIELEKDVVIPKDMLRFDVDGETGYGVGNIYGVSYDFWRCV